MQYLNPGRINSPRVFYCIDSLKSRLFYAVAPCLEAGLHGALIILSLVEIFLFRNIAPGSGWIVTGFPGCPLITLVTILGLLLFALPPFRVNEQFFRLCRFVANNRLRWRTGYHVRMSRRVPDIIYSVRIVIGNTTHPDDRVKRWQYRDGDTNRGEHHDEASRDSSVPHPAMEVVARFMINELPISTG